MLARLTMALMALPFRLAAQDCATVMAAPEVANLKFALDAIAAVPPVWSDYTLANHPVVFIAQSADTLAPACVAIWRQAQPPVVLPLPRGVRLATPLYGMWNGDPIGADATANVGIAAALSAVPIELEDALRALGESRAVLLPAPLRLDELGAFGAALKSMGIDPTLMLAQLAVHESYHLHSQFPTWLGQPKRYDWPAWDVQPDRAALVAKCYQGSDAVTAAHEREFGHLNDARAALESDAGAADITTRVRDAARAFVAARRERYALLDGVTIDSPAGPMTCAHAEDVMELEEGAPQWIAYSTAIRAGLMDMAKVGRAANEPFYVTGPLQLWILERLVGAEAMLNVTGEITRSAGPSGAIFGRVAAAVGG